MLRRGLGLVALAIAVLVLSGTAIAASHSLARPNAPPAWVTTAKQRLSNLDTKSAASMTGYAREKFGPAWFDVDLNGCSTRNDILARDLREVVFKVGDDCVVAKGTLHDRYTGNAINYVQGPMSSKVQIDHVVAHPGGPKVLTAYEQALDLDPGALRHARDVLRDHGNMSSPTCLFVLERFLAARDIQPGDTALLVALGAGFSAEYLLVRAASE